MLIYITLLAIILIVLSYIGYKMCIGYYRYDIEFDLAFNKEDYEIFSSHKRFVIVGSSSSGKSTLARNLCNKYPHLKRIELDYLSWLPGWKSRPKQEFRSLVSQTINQNSNNGWIIDGNYKSAKDIIWSKVEIVVWLEYQFWIVWYRAWKRTLTRIIFKSKVCNGNVESLSSIISNPMENFIPLWVYYNHSKYQHFIPLWKSQYPNVKIIKIPSPNHCKYWFKNLKI